LLIAWTALTLTAACSAPAAPTVRAVLFWGENCPHCHQVIERDLPPLQERFGEQLEIKMIRLSDPAGYEMWAEVLAEFRVPRERQGVPMLVIGDDVLIGSYEIPEMLPALIERHLEAGGVDYPDIAGLRE